MDGVGEDDEDYEFPSAKADPLDFVIVAVATTQQLVETLAKALDRLTYILVAHANHVYDRRKSINDFRLELETLPSTDQE